MIRPEAVEAAKKAYALPTSSRMEAAIAAFCEAEGLTVMLRTGSVPQRRLVGRWHDV